MLKMNHPLKTAGAFLLGGMTVLGIWLIADRRCIMKKMRKAMTNATDTMENMFKDEQCDSPCECENYEPSDDQSQNTTSNYSD